MSLPAAKIYLLTSLWSFLWLATAASVCAQYQIKSWTTDDGLPQNTVNSIVQTPDGYLWLATLDGLVRFDGVRFTVFNKNNSPGIESNRFRQIVVAPDGALWVGTDESGITRYANGEFQTFSIGGNKPTRQVTLNRRGNVVALTEDGVFEWNNGAAGFAPAAAVAGENGMSQVLWSKTGAFYYINEQPLYRVAGNRRTAYRLPRETTVRNLFEDSRGRIWVGTLDAGLFVLENERLTNYTVEDGLPGDDISPQMEDSDGNIWAIGLKGAVIFSPDLKISRLTTEDGLSDDVLNTIFRDAEGNVWAGGRTRGLNRISRQSVRFFSTKDGLAAAAVYPIYQTADGSILLGGDKITRWRDGKFERFAAQGAATAIHEDRRGRLWFGGWGNARHFENGKIVKFDQDRQFGVAASVMDVHETPDGAVWLASDKGLFRWRDNQMLRLTAADGLPSDDAKVIHESADGTIWIGFYGGLVRIADCGLRIADCRMQSYTVADGLASNRVRSLYEDADGVLWIGSYDGGLTRFKNGKFARFTSADGLFNDGVFQILEDDRQNLWMSSNRGIYRVSKGQLNDFAEEKLARLESIAYGKADGLLETECNGGQQPSGVKAKDGRLWFPTQGGVAVIDPREITTNSIAPPVVIESIKIDNELLDNVQSAIEILPGKNNLEINYTGLSFVKPEFVKFRYRLAGLNDDWVEAENRRTAYFSYLPPGDYTFQVVAANSDGVWNRDGASVRVRVVPPFYRTWWFAILAAASLFGLLALFYRQRVAKLERGRRVQAAFARRLIESQEQERQRIAAELHDGLSQSLVIIKNRAVLSLTTPDDAERAFEQMEEISAAASEAMFETKQIIYDLRPIQLDRFGLTKAVNAMLKKVGNAHNIKLAADIDSLDSVLSKDAESNLYRILQELINNVVRHSEAAEAGVSIKRTDDLITMVVRDDGRGFEPQQPTGDENGSNGFGLLGIAERTRLLRGHYEIQSAPGNGTIVKITIPIKENALRLKSENDRN